VDLYEDPNRAGGVETWVSPTGGWNSIELRALAKEASVVLRVWRCHGFTRAEERRNLDVQVD
jgi:hypothetical protein